MFFDEAPKRDLKDLYDYREELGQLVDAVRGGARLTVIEGQRRTGKTSLLLTALGQISQPSIIIDAREFASSATITRSDLIQALEKGLNKFLAENRSWRDRLLTPLKGVQGVDVETGLPPRISLKWGGKRGEVSDLASILDVMGRAAESQGTVVVLALDEAQEFRRLSGLNLSSLMAHVYDYVGGVQFVVTGSQVGMLNDFLGLDDPEAPLYGRALTRIRLGRLDYESSIEFLRLGFHQIPLNIDDGQLAIIVEKLDGIIGWLTYVGVVSRRLKRFDEDVLAEAVRLGAELAASEFKNFLSVRPQAESRYTLIMKSMCEGPRRWSEVKRFVEISEGRTIPDFTFNHLLRNTVKGGYVEKRPTGLYEIADPLLYQAAKDRLL